MNSPLLQQIWTNVYEAETFDEKYNTFLYTIQSVINEVRNENIIQMR